MFESYKLKKNLKRQDLEYQYAVLDYTTSLMKGLKKFEGATANVVRDEDDADWIIHGSDTEGRPSATDHSTMLEQAFKLWRSNLHARAIVRTMVKFVIGKGANVMPKDDNEARAKKAKEVWEDFKKVNKWNHREKELFTRLYRDGEVFIRKFKSKDTMKVRFIRASRIKNPVSLKEDKEGKYKGLIVTYGIGHNPEDVEDCQLYLVCDEEGNLKYEVKADEIVHYKIFADSDMKRGISLLEVCAPMLKKYEGWLEDRITLNKIRTAIALIKKVNAPMAQVQAVRDSLETETRDADRKKLKMPASGTVITTSPGIDYEMLSPRIQAGDVANDGRNMLLSIAAGVGFPEMILTADYSNANYSSTLIAQNPFVREIEDQQDFAATIYKEIYAEVIQGAIDNKKLAENTELECDVEFAPLIHQDMKQEDEAMEIEHRNKVVSRTTWQLKRGYDPETEKGYIETEQGDEIYPVVPPSEEKPSGEEEEEGELRDIK